MAMENELRINISTDYIYSTSRDVMLESNNDTCAVQEMLHHSVPTMDVKSCKKLSSKEIISRPDVNNNYLGPRNTIQTAASQMQDDTNDYLLLALPMCVAVWLPASCNDLQFKSVGQQFAKSAQPLRGPSLLTT